MLKLFFDIYYYFSSYQDFIAEIDFTQTTGASDPQGIVDGNVETQRYGFDINADGNVTSHGWAAGLDYSLPRGFRLNSNISWNKLIDQQDLIDQGFSPLPPVMPEWKLSSFPRLLGSWKGTESPIDERIFAKRTFHQTPRFRAV